MIVEHDNRNGARVMPPSPGDRFSQLIAELGDLVGLRTPPWTDANVHDPGVALLEVLAYSLEDLAARPRLRIDSALLDRIRRALGRLDRSAGRDAPPCVTRSHFFTGRLLSADDLNREQEYVRGRDRRLALALSGPGVVRGLGVGVEGDSIAVSPGVAIDPTGEVLVVDCAQTVAVPPAISTASIVVRYAERLESPIAVTTADDTNTTEFAVVVECAEVAVVELPHADDLVIARIRRDPSGVVIAS